MILKRLIFALLITFSFASCSSDDDAPTTDRRSIKDLEADFQALNLQPGINDVSLENLNGSSWNFRVIIPENASSSERPLVLTLHGAASGNANAHKNTACYAEPGFAALDPFIVSPNGGTQLWNSAFNQDLVIGLMYLTQKYLNVDRNKTVVTGYSNGGNGSWFYAEVYPEIFTASIPMASSYSTFSSNGSVRTIETPLYVIHGENDELFPVAETQEWVAATKEAGTNVTLEVAPGLTHYESCNYVPYLQNAASWLQDEVWD